MASVNECNDDDDDDDDADDEVGRGRSAGTCGLDDVFPPEDLGSGSYT